MVLANVAHSRTAFHQVQATFFKLVLITPDPKRTQVISQHYGCIGDAPLVCRNQKALLRQALPCCGALFIATSRCSTSRCVATVLRQSPAVERDTPERPSTTVVSVRYCCLSTQCQRVLQNATHLEAQSGCRWAGTYELVGYPIMLQAIKQ
jgi:hypothetical protein